MTEPSQRSSRNLLAAGATVALTLAIGGYILGRSASTPSTAPAVAPAASVEPRLPVVTPPIGRAELLDAVEAAADAYAAGQAGTPGNAELVGRRFELRIPFGCYGPSPEGSEAKLRWSYDVADQALRVSIAPEVWTDIAWVRALAGDGAEAVEGFWLPRPWSRTESCPTPDARLRLPPILPMPQQTVGLAQFFEAGGARASRRGGRPYEHVEKLAVESLRTDEGFRIVLTGRLSALANGQPVGCHSAGAELRPTCLVAVEFDRVAIENAVTGAELAEWTAS